MEKNKISLFTLLSFLMLMCILAVCSNNAINMTKDQGKFDSSKSEAITIEYNIKSTKGFYNSIDFELVSGKVDWEIVNPKNEIVYKGYASYENGKVYRELTYPKDHGKYLNSKEVVSDIPDFNFLTFDRGNLAGTYKLTFKPDNAEGSYIVEWGDKLPRK